MKELGPEVQWVHSYLTDDKLFCVHIAPNEDMVLKHAESGGFPVDNVSQVKMCIDPTTAE